MNDRKSATGIERMRLDRGTDRELEHTSGSGKLGEEIGNRSDDLGVRSGLVSVVGCRDAFVEMTIIVHR